MSNIRLDLVNKFFYNLQSMREVAEQLGYIIPEGGCVTAEILLGIMQKKFYCPMQS